MKLFVFGAGASVGSQGGSGRIKAPLTKDLFDEQYIEYGKGFGFNVHDFKQFTEEVIAADNDLEKWLTRRWEDVNQRNSPKSKDAGKKEFGNITYYLRWLFVQISQHPGLDIYENLIRKLIKSDKDFGLINFNYDLLLDRAYQKHGGGFSLHNLDSYIDNSYLKPHGSINWYLLPRNTDPRIQSGYTNHEVDVNKNRAVACMYKDTPISMSNMIVHDPYSITWKNETFVFTGNGDYVYPLFVLPVLEKTFSHFENFKEKLMKPALELASKATEVYLIGYQAKGSIIHEVFKNIRQGTTLNVIDFGSASKIYNEVKEKTPAFDIGIKSDEGFKKFVEDLM